MRLPKKDMVQNEWRKDFPFLMNNPDLIYFDNSATTQKPQCVIDAICNFYAEENSPVGRSSYALARKAERRCEEARRITAAFIGAQKEEIVFTKSATEAVNIVANTYALKKLDSRHNIVVTALEHNSNFLPWREICTKTRADLRVVKLDENGFPDLEDLEQKIDNHTVIVAATCASNFLHGNIAYEKTAELCQYKKVPLILDAAQLMLHRRIDVSAIKCDFLFLSGHKILAPAGIGVLYGREERLAEMKPFLVGGGIVMGDDLEYMETAAKFEAGTQDTAARLGLASAIMYRNQIDEEKLVKYENQLCKRLFSGFATMEKYGVRILGNKELGAPIFSFVCDRIHFFDIAALLGHYNIAVRSGKLCAQTAFSQLGVEGCVRLSLCVYNTVKEIDVFFETLEFSLKKLKHF